MPTPSSSPTLGIPTLGIIGAGVMGRGIAQIAAEAGLTVLLADARPQACDQAKQFCADLIRRKVAKGMLAPAAAEAAIGNITPTQAGPQTGYGPFAACDIIIEAVAERMDVKTALLKDLGIRRPRRLHHRHQHIVAVSDEHCRSPRSAPAESPAFISSIPSR